MSNHLTEEQRCVIFSMTKKALAHNEISEAVGVSKSTIRIKFLLS